MIGSAENLGRDHIYFNFDNTIKVINKYQVIFGTRNARDEVTFSPTFYPNFFHLCNIYSSSGNIISHHIFYDNYNEV